MKRLLNISIVILISILILSFFIFCNSETNATDDEGDAGNTSNSCIKSIGGDEIIQCEVKVIREIPHKGERTFTQGFEIYDGFIYEGTGQYDETALKKLDMRNGQILRQQFIEEYFSPDEVFFGEGITIWNDQIIQLSWKKGEAYTYDMNFNKLEKVFTYDTQGWGLTHNDTQLIMSDGSPYIYFRNPETFEIEKEIYVGVADINELEYVNGIIYANVWKEKYIIMIDEKTGNILARIDGSELLCANLENQDSNAVLNGIAYDKETDTYYITGKRCPLIYEVTFEYVDN